MQDYLKTNIEKIKSDLKDLKEDVVTLKKSAQEKHSSHAFDFNGPDGYVFPIKTIDELKEL